MFPRQTFHHSIPPTPLPPFPSTAMKEAAGLLTIHHQSASQRPTLLTHSRQFRQKRRRMRIQSWLQLLLLQLRLPGIAAGCNNKAAGVGRANWSKEPCAPKPTRLLIIMLPRKMMWLTPLTQLQENGRFRRGGASPWGQLLLLLLLRLRCVQ